MAALANKDEGQRGALRVLLVGEADDKRQEVKSALASLGDPALEIVEAVPGPGRAANGGPPPDVTMVLFNGGNEEASLNYLQSEAEDDSPSRPVLFALVQERSPVLMRRILRAGADELLFLPLDIGDATRALLKISETRRKAERQTGGVVISLVSTVGGVGVTSLTANLALALRYTLNKRVAVVDLDLQTGGLAVFLNLEPERTIMQLCEGDRKLDSIQLESALTKHPSGIYLLAAPKRIEDSELVADKTIGAVLDLMRQLFDYVLVDCGGYIDENAVAAWERSDYLFYLLDQSISAARCAWRFVDLFGRLGLSAVEPSFILGRYQPHHPISEEQITHTLGRTIYAKIPRDEKVLERVQLRAQDLWQVGPGSPLARAVEDLARRLASGGEATTEQGGIVSRLLSAFGQRN
ncbi:MAG TPA: AAA family ATPase [Candidatus Binataceae bacterium]|nr:AAA family ATPase [Candidatus Binataceae bacterium]